MELTTFFDFCSGIGGGRLGLEKAGLRCIGYSDTSRLSVKTYNLMFDSLKEKNYGNLKKIDPSSLPNYDLLIAGFPCQSFSVIGRREGFSDLRGQIIYYLAKILQKSKPKCFILENVRGLVSHDKGKTLKTILSLLEGAGYDVTFKVLNSIDYGVPQMRQRVYFVGFEKKLGLDLGLFDFPSPVVKPPLSNYLTDFEEATEEQLWYFMNYLSNKTNLSKYSMNDILSMDGKVIDTRMSDLRIYEDKVPTLRSQRDGIFYVKNNKLYSLTGNEALLLQGFPIEYANRVKDIVSNRHLLCQAGNAMTVNVIEALAKSIKYFVCENHDGL